MSSTTVNPRAAQARCCPAVSFAGMRQFFALLNRGAGALARRSCCNPAALILVLAEPSLTVGLQPGLTNPGQLFAHQHVNDARTAKAGTHRDDALWLNLHLADNAGF